MATTTVIVEKKWSTIHIFGYGETQIIGEDLNKKVLTSSLNKVQSLVTAILALKPIDSEITTNEYHSITILNNNFISWQSKEKANFRINFTECDSQLIENLVTELDSIVIEPTTQS
jgi:hypothetical protein